MYRFFINRPIVAMVIAILMVLVGLVSMVALPVAQFPNIAPPEIRIQTTYVGADAQTLEQSVATPIEQQMSGADNLDYMYSINPNSGQMWMILDFDVKTDPNIDMVLAQIRQAQAQSQLPLDVQKYGITLLKAPTTPMLVIALSSPNATYDATFLANYAYINLNDPIARLPGIGNVQIFGAGQYAMRLWVRPDRLAQMGVTVGDIVNAINTQNTVNPAGQVGGAPIPKGQEFTYAGTAQGRLISEAQFGQIVLRANPDGSLLRLKDVARVELGAQVYNLRGRLNGRPAALILIYQLPGSNALEVAREVRRFMEQASKRFPPGLEFTYALDTTLAVSEGIREIVKTLWEALLLVILVVFIFLQNWRASIIPMLAIPTSLIGTFAFFPLFGFSINTLSLFGLVLAIGLVVDDAIVVVEAVERHIEEGMEPKAATFRAMEEVSGPVVATALILAAVFIPTVFIPGITGRLYQQFALTIAISVAISAFNALTLSPALSALLLRPRTASRGPLAKFFNGFNRVFARATDRYVHWSGFLVRKSGFALLLLLLVTLVGFLMGRGLPTSFLPQEDQGYAYINVQLPVGASLDRTDDVCKQFDSILQHTPGVQYVTTIMGFSFLSQAQATYNAFYFITLKPWGERKKPDEQFGAIAARLMRGLAQVPGAVAFPFPPPAIPGVGTSGGFTFVLEDRSGRELSFLTQNVNAFMEAARKRPELANLNTTYLPSVPQIFFDVDRDKVLRQGINLADVYQTLQTFLGGYFINYFNRFGRQWQVYVEAEGEFRTRPENIGLFYVRNSASSNVPLSSVTRVVRRTGPEFVMHFNEYRSAQINGSAAPGYSSAQAIRALEEVFAQTMPPEMGFDYMGMSFQEKKAAQGVPRSAIFGLSLVFVFLILAAQYESWSLPFSVLMSTPVAIFGAFLALSLRQFENNVYVQIGMIMLIGLAAKNAILIVEYAKTEYERGRPIIDSALDAGRIRLRPILMTSFAFVFGLAPLWVASGAGAVGRRNLGTTVIGGMLGASLLGIFIIPVSFYVVEWLVHRFSKRGAPERPGGKPRK